MCGIFGMVARSEAAYSHAFIEKSLGLLAKQSQSRGKDSSGLVFRDEQTGTYQVIKGAIPQSSYQAVYNAEASAGRRPIALNAYTHGGRAYIAAVFGNRPTKLRKDRHGMSSAQYQAEYTSALRSGALTQAVAGTDGGTSHRFVATWFTY